MSFPIVVLISGNGSNLQAIIDKCHTPGHVDIKAVISDQPNVYGLHRALQANLNAGVHKQIQDESREDYCYILADIVEDYQPELIVLAGFMKVLTSDFIDRFSNKIINIHPSLLPKYKGGGPSFSTHRLVLQNKDSHHGMTIHWVTEELDSGPIIIQRSFPIMSDDNEETVEKKVHTLEHIWYPWVVNQISTGYIKYPT